MSAVELSLRERSLLATAADVLAMRLEDAAFLSPGAKADVVTLNELTARLEAAS